MIAMILAAGRGERLMPLTRDTPKPLIKVQGVALIEYALNACKRAGIKEIVVNVAYLSECIKTYLGDGSEFGVQIHYSDESDGALETAGGIIKALPLLGKEPFVVINSDVICDYDLSQLSLPQGSLAHLVLVDNPAHNLNGDFGLQGQQVSLESNNSLTFSGIGLYHPDFFQAHQHSTEKLPLYPLLKSAIKQQQLTGEYYQGQWQDIGTAERLALANQDKSADTPDK